jgi:hypothetical protein
MVRTKKYDADPAISKPALQQKTKPHIFKFIGDSVENAGFPDSSMVHCATRSYASTLCALSLDDE